MKLKYFFLFAAILLSGCGAPYQAAFPIRLGEFDSRATQVVNIKTAGFYTLALAFARSYEFNDKESENAFNRVVLSGSEARPANIRISLRRDAVSLLNSDYSLSEAGGVKSVEIDKVLVSSNIRVFETVSLVPGEYLLEYENLHEDKELGALDTYILIFLDEPKA